MTRPAIDSDCRYGLSTLPEYRLNGEPGNALIWVHPTRSRPPALGERVRVKANDLGLGTVAAYFYEFGNLGIEVRLDGPPAWHRQQRPDGRALVFGIEWEGVEAP